MKKYWNLLLAMSRTVLVWVLLVGLLCGVMLYQLGSITPGISPAEAQTYSNTRSLSEVASIMINAPYNTAVYLATHVIDSAFGLRFTGALVGIASTIVFFLLASKISGRNIAFVSTAMFATTNSMLTASRTATPTVMMLSLLALVTCGYFFRFNKQSNVLAVLLAAALALSLYVPGMIFFVAIGAVWQFGRLKKQFENLRTPTIIISSSIFGILIVPLIVGFIRSPEIWRSFIGLPADIAPVTEMIKTVAKAAASIFIVSPGNNPAWVGRQPILDVFAVAMFVYGVILLFKNYKLDRLWVIFGIFIITAAWVAVTNNIASIFVAIPFVYLVNF